METHDCIAHSSSVASLKKKTIREGSFQIAAIETLGGF